MLGHGALMPNAYTLLRDAPSDILDLVPQKPLSGRGIIGGQRGGVGRYVTVCVQHTLTCTHKKQFHNFIKCATSCPIKIFQLIVRSAKKF